MNQWTNEPVNHLIIEPLNHWAIETYEPSNHMNHRTFDGILVAVVDAVFDLVERELLAGDFLAGDFLAGDFLAGDFLAVAEAYLLQYFMIFKLTYSL